MMIVTAFTTSCWSWPEVMKPSQTLTFHFEAQKRSGRNFRRRRSYSDFSLQLSPLIVSTIWSFLISLGIVFWWKNRREKEILSFEKNFDFFIFSSMVATQKNVAFKNFDAFSFLLWDEWKVIKANVRGFESRRSIIVSFSLSMFVFRLMSNCTENCNFQGWFIVLSWLCWLEPWACYRTVLGLIPATFNLFLRTCCCNF